MDRHNILYISTTGNDNKFGAETRFLDILKKLDRQRFTPIVLLPEEGPLADEVRSIGVEIHIFNFLFRVKRVSPRTWLKCARFLWRLLKDKRVSLVHLNMHYFLANIWLPVLCARLPLVVHCRTCAWIDTLERVLMTWSHKILFVSQAAKQSFYKPRRSDIFCHTNCEKGSIIYDGIDLTCYNGKPNGRCAAIRKELGLKKNDKVIALIGALSPIKGQDLFILAAKKMCEKRDDIKFLVVGDVYYRKPAQVDFKIRLKKMVQDFGLENNVVFTGYRDDIKDILGEAHIAVQPSTEESLGTALVEAMASGKPVIASNVGGLPEVVGKNEAGFLLPERSPEALAKAVTRLLNEPELYTQMSAGARQRAVRLFDIDKNVRKIEAIYEQALMPRIKAAKDYQHERKRYCPSL